MKIKSKKSYKNVTLSIDIEVPIDKILDSGTTANVGRTMRDESIKFMERGISPVTGTRFEKYKNPDKYPGKSLGNKKKTPVNLKLSGDLHSSLSHKKISDTAIEFGLLNPKGKAGIYGAVHNRDDSGRPDIPERKFLPTKIGETFNRTIMKAIKDLIIARLKKLTK